MVWSLAYSSSEDSRLEEAESTLARMQRYLGAEGTPPAQAPLRIRMDRLILLNRLGRHAQVREEARALQAEGHALPDYVLPAVGDSLMGTLHPEEAIPVLQAAVAGDPTRDASHSELAYAYLESEQQEKAVDLLQAWRDKEPAWRWSNGKSPYPNWSRYEADLNLAMVRAYSGDLPTAQRDLESMVDIAPGNGGLQSALGSVYMMRGWPRRALQRQQMAHALDPRDIEPRLGMQEAYVALQRDDLARPLHDDLVARYPTQPAVERMDQAWRAHRGWQLKAWTDIGRSSGGVAPRRWATMIAAMAWRSRHPYSTIAGGCSPSPTGARSISGPAHRPAVAGRGRTLPLRPAGCGSGRAARQRPHWRYRPARRRGLAVQRLLACRTDCRTQ